MPEYKRIELNIRKSFAKNWKKLADMIGVNRSTLVHFAMWEFIQKHAPNFEYTIEEATEFKKCPICNKEFDIRGFPTHYKACLKQWNEKKKAEEKKRKKYKCEFCEKIYSTEDGLNKHLNFCKENPKNVFIKHCQYCGKDFDPRGFATHEKACKLKKAKAPISKDKMERLRNQKKFDGASRYGVSPGDIF